MQMKPPVREDTDEGSESSSDSSDAEHARRAAAHFVQEDMQKLERIFQAKNMQYRLIDRIGEGQ